MTIVMLIVLFNPEVRALFVADTTGNSALRLGRGCGDGEQLRQPRRVHDGRLGARSADHRVPPQRSRGTTVTTAARVLCLALLVGAACGRTPVVAPDPSPPRCREDAASASEVILRVTTQFAGGVGYGSLYECRVRQIVKGGMADPSLTLVFLGGNEPVAFADAGPDTVLELGFVKQEQGVPYAMMPLTGFVDTGRTSWRLVYICGVDPGVR